MQMTREQLRSFDLRVWQQGDGAGLLYLHGLERHPGAAPFLDRLAEERDVRAPELPGYGESTGVEHLHDVQDVALLYRALIDSWGFESVDVVGHALGGMLAAELAVVAPHRVRSLVLVNAFGLWLEDQPMSDVFTMSPPELDAAKWHNPEAKESETGARGGSSALDLAIERTTNLGTATKFLWPIPDRGLRRRLCYISAPTLVIHGESDGIVPLAHAEELARLLPNAELEIMPLAGHLPMFEAEDQFVNAVQKFVALHGG
jgi:pimeloyl-ACP methyl ester carboxylesterase